MKTKTMKVTKRVMMIDFVAAVSSFFLAKCRRIRQGGMNMEANQRMLPIGSMPANFIPNHSNKHTANSLPKVMAIVVMIFFGTMLLASSVFMEREVYREKLVGALPRK